MFELFKSAAIILFAVFCIIVAVWSWLSINSPEEKAFQAHMIKREAEMHAIADELCRTYTYPYTQFEVFKIVHRHYSVHSSLEQYNDIILNQIERDKLYGPKKH